MYLPVLCIHYHLCHDVFITIAPALPFVGHSAALFQLLQSTLGAYIRSRQSSGPACASPRVETTPRPHADGYLQINELAIFGECVGAVAWIPTILALLFPILRYGLRPAWNRRSIWLRDFAAEEPGEAEAVSTDLTPVKRRTWSLPTVVLILSSTTGLVVSILAALNPATGPLFSTPLIPHVSTRQEMFHQTGINWQGGRYDHYTTDREAPFHPGAGTRATGRAAARSACHVQHHPAGLLQVRPLDLGN